LALLLALVSRGNVWQANVPMFEAPNLSRGIVHNVLALGEEADFEALNFLPALNLIRSTKLHLSTEPAFLPNCC
jgi:hypothetical protein